MSAHSFIYRKDEDSKIKFGRRGAARPEQKVALLSFVNVASGWEAVIVNFISPGSFTLSVSKKSSKNNCATRHVDESSAAHPSPPGGT